jgi:hypothetical protein
MIGGSEQVEVRDVEVVAATYFTLRCIIGGRFVGVPSLKTLPGTDVARRGDRGRLILPRDVAERLGLAWGLDIGPTRSSVSAADLART